MSGGLCGKGETQAASEEVKRRAGGGGGGAEGVQPPGSERGLDGRRSPYPLPLPTPYALSGTDVPYADICPRADVRY
eukprot:500330-Rhodomonas_salina.3